jgi:CDP-diacylglycerol--serine O-phosphatidyltransferase
MIFIGKIHLSILFILIAILADGLDGIVARKTRSSSIGEYLDSMADMTSFGIAPAFFIYTIYYNVISSCIYKHFLLLLVLVVFLSLSIIRLASFHIMNNKKFFVGLPVPSGAIFLIIMAYLNVELVYILPAIIIISFLMVSNVRFPKPSFKIDAIAACLIFFTIIMDRNFNSIAPIVLLIAICGYVIVGPFYLLANGKKQ